MFRTPQLVLFTRDITRAIAFYTALGFTEAFRTPAEGEPIHVDLVLDGYRIGQSWYGARPKGMPEPKVKDGPPRTNHCCVEGR